MYFHFKNEEIELWLSDFPKKHRLKVRFVLFQSLKALATHLGDAFLMLRYLRSTEKHNIML